MDGVTLVFNKTYYCKVVEIDYLYGNESLNLALNSNNGLQLDDGWYRNNNDMTCQSVIRVLMRVMICYYELFCREKGHWLRGMRWGRVLCATSFVCLGKAICVHTSPSAEKRFPFKPSFSYTLSASSRPALPAAAPASRYAVHCSCSSSVVESVRGDNKLCDMGCTK